MVKRKSRTPKQASEPSCESDALLVTNDLVTSTHFFVHGTPTTQGSKSLMRVRGRVMMIETSKGLHAWRSAVATSAVKAGIKISEGDVAIKIIAYWVRPQCHVTSEGLPRKSCPPRPRYADCDKLARAICDALAGIAYRNDRQVAVLTVERKWCEENQSTGAMITVEKLPALPLDCLKPSLK